VQALPPALGRPPRRRGAPEGAPAGAGERQEEQREEQEERPAADAGGRQELDHYETLFPALKGKKLQVAGFVWFQGWNDQYGGQDEYASNLKHFITDVRQDLRAPTLPFVIAAMGQNGSKPATGAMLTIQKAQLSMNDVPEFRGNVKAIRTDVLVEKAAEELYPDWRKDIEKWKRVGGDHGYHYLGSAIWFDRIGRARGEAMLELLKQNE
jgi:alpha-galactosidase